MAGPFEADEVGHSQGGQANGEHDEFDRAVAQFLREYLEAEPVGASFYGLTEWDGLLPDLTAAGFAEREAAARVVRIMPVEYSPVMVSTPSTAIASWPIISAPRLVAVGSHGPWAAL